MLNMFRSLCADRCPQCKELLQARRDHLHVLKSCPQGHYKEETYASLGVRIVYDLK
ncbi:hypothetical protein ACE3MQ_22890 [Paenibacillus lentus]|uniref:hypothetical protein n=1 Tax=Paenibacillus lentus TaxID=1338368 RepID=UPI00365846C7